MVTPLALSDLLRPSCAVGNPRTVFDGPGRVGLRTCAEHPVGAASMLLRGTQWPLRRPSGDPVYRADPGRILGSARLCGRPDDDSLVVVTAQEFITERPRCLEAVPKRWTRLPRIACPSGLPFRYGSELLRTVQRTKQSRVVKARDILTTSGEPFLPLLDEILDFALLDLPMTRRPEALAHRGHLLSFLCSRRPKCASNPALNGRGSTAAPLHQF